MAKVMRPAQLSRERPRPTSDIYPCGSRHDAGWPGTVCADPVANHACMLLDAISKKRDDQFEADTIARTGTL